MNTTLEALYEILDCNNSTGGCLRRTVAPSPTESPPITSSPTHRQACTLEEVKSAACAVGHGQCYAVELQGERKSFCSCFDDWVGKRCQEMQIPLDWLESRSADQIRTASIAAGVSISILVVFIALIAIYVYIRWRKKERLLRDRQFEATAEELYRRPFSGRTSIVESISRASSVRRGVGILSGDVVFSQFVYSIFVCRKCRTRTRSGRPRIVSDEVPHDGTCQKNYTLTDKNENAKLMIVDENVNGTHINKEKQVPDSDNKAECGNGSQTQPLNSHRDVESNARDNSVDRETQL